MDNTFNFSLEQRLSLITLGADNLETMRNFYEETLGWKPVAQNKDIVFYLLNGFLFSITGRKFLAELVGISPEGSGFRSMTIAYNVPTENEVREIYDKLKEKGVKLLTEPTAPPFGGLYFYFSDVEGNVIEVACNDFIPSMKTAMQPGTSRSIIYDERVAVSPFHSYLSFYESNSIFLAGTADGRRM